MTANVHSLEAIDGLRKKLASFADQVSDALTEIDSEMRRMLEWLEHDRPRYWKQQFRESINQVHEAQQALHRCLMFPIADERPSCREERAALKRAQARQAYCEEKVERVRHWHREVQHELFEYQGRISQLVRLIEVDIPQAMAILHKIIRHLEEYQSIRVNGPPVAYDDIALVQDLWPAERPIDGNPEAAIASNSKAASSVTNTPDSNSPSTNPTDLCTEARSPQNP